MGNIPTCEDCNTEVPKAVIFFDTFLWDSLGGTYSKHVYGDVWVLLEKNKYLCAGCLERRQTQERDEEKRKEQNKEKQQKEEFSNQKQDRLETENTLRKQQAEEYDKCDKRFQNWKKRKRENINERNFETQQILEKSPPHLTKTSYKQAVQHMPSNSSFFQAKWNEMKIESNKVFSKKSDNKVIEEIRKRDDSKLDAKSIKHTLDMIWQDIDNYKKQSISFKGYTIKNPSYNRVPRYLHENIDYIEDKEAQEELSHRIFEICLAVHKTKKYWPRNTQIISLFLLIKNVEKGILLEINTGEGKTCITAMFAVFLALSGRSVDVISSSPILAQRDFNEWKDFYEYFRITIGCNLTPKQDEERQKCYENKVVYGTVSSFASDLLRQDFLMNNVRGNRECDAVLIDEVDCLLLDQGINFTYLSNTVPGMHHLEQILCMIWDIVIKHPKIKSESSELFFVGDMMPIHIFLANYIDIREYSADKDAAHEMLWLQLLSTNTDAKFYSTFMEELEQDNLFNMENFKNMFSIEKLLSCLHFAETISTLKFRPYIIVNNTTIRQLVMKDSVDTFNTIDVLIVGEGLVCELYRDENELYRSIQSNIEHHICFTTSSDNAREIPRYLEQFVKNRLPVWIENAFMAKDMSEGREYIVRDTDVVPVDFESTGVVQLDTKLGDCLQQLLEIKHRRKLSLITLVTNFMSNQELFKNKYPHVFGVSGTLGNKQEKSFLRQQFNLDCIHIPTHRTKVFHEIPGKICKSECDWIRTIVTKVKQLTTSHKQRVVLLVCEDINTAKFMNNELKDVGCKYVTVYTKNNENNDKIKQKFKGGDIIVATNIAGRGTDIKLDESVANAGGLFVLVSFLPQNTRIENQVFGRSARTGQPGTVQIILNTERLPIYLQHCADINTLKDTRNHIEENRIADIEQNELQNLQLKENLFSRYCRFLREIKPLPFNEVDRKIMLDSLHEFWGMWLKMNFNKNSKTENELQEKLERDVELALSDVKVKTSPCKNISHVVKFANEELQNGYFNEAQTLFNSAIESDPKWAAVAYYNRAFCSLQQRQDGYLEKAISDLKKATNGLKMFKQEMVLCLSSSEHTQESNNEQFSTNSLQSQFSTRCQIIQFFEENMKASIEQLESLKRDNKQAIVESSSIFTIALGDEIYNKRIESELYLFWELGLTEVIMVKEKKPFCWKGLLVAVLGVIQIALGTLLISATSGVLTNLGWALITEGVNDICTGAYAVIKGDQEFMKSWMIGKAVNVSVSMLTFGFSQARNAATGTKGVKGTIRAVAEKLNSGTKAVLTEIKTIPKAVMTKSIRPIFKETCKVVGKEVGSKFAKRGGKYFLMLAQEKVTIFFEEETEKQLRIEVTSLFVQGQLHETVDGFTLFHVRAKKLSPEEICKRYMDIMKETLSSKKRQQLRPIILGCVKGILHFTKKKMKSEDFDYCKPVFDFIGNIKCTPYDVKQLVQTYQEHVNHELQNIYENICNIEKSDIIESEKKETELIRKMIIEKTIDYLLKLLKESMEFTGSGFLADKLQNIMEKIAPEFAGENFGKEKIQQILAISHKAVEFGQTVITNEQVDFSTVINTGLEVAETVAVATDCTRMKKIIRISQHGLQIFKNFQRITKNELDVATIVLDITGLTKVCVAEFADDTIKQKAEFVLDSASELTKAIQGGDIDVMLTTSINITRKGIATFGNDKMKKIGFLSMNMVMGILEAIQLQNTYQIVRLVIDIINDGVSVFGDDTTVMIVKCANDVFRAAESLLMAKSLNEVIEKNEIDIIKTMKNCFVVFADDKLKQKAHFIIDTLYHVASAVKSRSLDSLLSGAINIAKKGIYFCKSEQLTETETFSTKMLIQIIDVYRGKDVTTIVNMMVEIVQEAISVFGDKNSEEFVEFEKHVRDMTDMLLRETRTDKVIGQLDIMIETIKKWSSTFADKKFKICAMLDSGRDVVVALTSGNLYTSIKTVTDVTQKLIDICENFQMKKILQIAIKTVRKGLDALESKCTKELVQLISDDGLSTFDDVEAKAIFDIAAQVYKTTENLLKVKCVSDIMERHILEELKETVKTCLTGFADEQTKQKANFFLDATFQITIAVKNEKCKNLDYILDTAKHVINDGIDKFGNEQMKKHAKFALEAVADVLGAIQSGNVTDIVRKAVKIIDEGLKTFNVDN